MPHHPDSIEWYNQHAAEAASLYESLSSAESLSWLDGLLPPPSALIVDIGAGSGRDAAFLASLGHDVIAIEPAAAMREDAKCRHHDQRIRWIDDRLPALSAALRLGLSADAVLASAVWMHVAPKDRARAFRKLASMLKPGGLLALSLRHGPAEPERGIHPVSLAELEALSRDNGLSVARVERTSDRFGRPEVFWTNVALRLPDDGTGALPLLRHVILVDDKSSTYKLGLLRSLCKAADGAAGLARDEDDHVVIPLGLVALNWLRLYLPLLQPDLPQSPSNVRRGEKLGFAKEAFTALLERAAAGADLHVGARLSGEAARAVAGALRVAGDTIAGMPARYLTYPNDSRPIFPVERTRSTPAADQIALTGDYLESFGTLRVPRHLWQALQRHAAWIEPALIAEWIRLMRAYAERQGRRLDEGALARAMTWSDPTREVVLARGRAVSLMQSGQRVLCVWSGRLLDAASLDIDHCVPWSAWPCSDLWNLMPSHRLVNQREKRDKLPSAEALNSAEKRILEWWKGAYLAGDDVATAGRFVDEAKASLPALRIDDLAPTAEDVFGAVDMLRLRLRRDQQIPEWSGSAKPSRGGNGTGCRD